MFANRRAVLQQPLRQALGEADRFIPRLEIAVGDQNIEGEFRVGFSDRPQLVLDLTNRGGDCALVVGGTGDCEALPRRVDVSSAIAEILSHLVRQMDPGELRDQLEERAVLDVAFFERSLELRANRVDQPRGGLAAQVPVLEVVGHRTQERDVEGEALLVGRDDDGRTRAGGVPNAEFVEDVRVLIGDVDDRDFGQQQALEHRKMDDAASLLLVGADDFEFLQVDRRLDASFVDVVEIDLERMRHIPLEAEGHSDEHKRLHVSFS